MKTYISLLSSTQKFELEEVWLRHANFQSSIVFISVEILRWDFFGSSIRVFFALFDVNLRLNALKCFECLTKVNSFKTRQTLLQNSGNKLFGVLSCKHCQVGSQMTQNFQIF